MSDLVVHWRDHAEGRDFCRLCGEPFADAAHQRRHFAQHAAPADDPQQNCDKCLQGFSDVTDMQKHMADSHPGRNVAVD
ncbi:hypothetical protein LSTR_LSTR016678 [Laodelphax striatellus]|uniref:C2H2-type domain-containing protein n=1 Tax=Laodelphax striatellus TaxID=195883 RepID=A0A482WWD9_LAOST|nr:hypothetical protein LSTR_LSTR016678 [Laodelphax striatellus]